MPPPSRLPAVLVLAALLAAGGAGAMEILSKSSIKTCATDSGAGGRLSCGKKLVINVAVPSGSSGGEASLVVKVIEAEQRGSETAKVVRDPPVITINKSAVYAAYDLVYIRDVAYKPVEEFVENMSQMLVLMSLHPVNDFISSLPIYRNLFGAKRLVVVAQFDKPANMCRHMLECFWLRNESGSIMEHTEPVCCPCGHHRVSTSCGSFFDKTFNGKHNTAHCVRFHGEWFHVFGIGKWSLGFRIGVNVVKSSSISELVVGPDNRTVISEDNFLRVNIIGDYAGNSSIQSLEHYYLVTPRENCSSGKPQAIGNEYSRWMLLAKSLFTENGDEYDKIGVGYEAFQNQPDFCSSSFGSCLKNQLWNFLEGDQDRLNKGEQPLYIVKGRFQRINQHPDAGVYSFSVGVTEALNTNLRLELNADDIEYIYQWSPGRIISIEVPTFEALHVGTANIRIKNIGKLEASYSLTFDCSRGINHVEEKRFTLKPDESILRSFDLHTSTDEAAKYQSILKASNSSELDRAECEFSTVPTVLNNGTQIVPSDERKKSGTMGILASIEAFWRWICGVLIDFFTGRSSRTKCSSFFDLRCHFKYPWVVWFLMFSMLLGAVAAVAVFLWLLHQNGYFDRLYNWWEGMSGQEPAQHRMGRKNKNRHHRQSHYHGEVHRGEDPHHHHGVLHKRNSVLGVQHEDTKKHVHLHDVGNNSFP